MTSDGRVYSDPIVDDKDKDGVRLGMPWETYWVPQHPICKLCYDCQLAQYI